MSTSATGLLDSIIDLATLDLADRQVAILDCIREYRAQHGYSPSIREIGDAVGLTSTSSVHHQLRKLEDLGVLVRVPHRSRTALVAGAAA